MKNQIEIKIKSYRINDDVCISDVDNNNYCFSVSTECRRSIKDIASEIEDVISENIMSFQKYTKAQIQDAAKRIALHSKIFNC